MPWKQVQIPMNGKGGNVEMQIVTTGERDDPKEARLCVVGVMDGEVQTSPLSDKQIDLIISKLKQAKSEE